jgi:hypothetical protein
MQTTQFLLAGWLAACGEPIDDPSAYTELGIPAPRYQLGWGVEDVPWDSMSATERADVLRNQLVVLKAEARDDEARRTAAALLEALREIDLYDDADDADDAAALDALRDQVVRLDAAVR